METSKLKQALELSLINDYMSETPEEKEIHVFSPEFEKKMNKLIKRQKKPYYRFTNTAWKRTVCAAAVSLILLTAILSIEAIRTPFVNFFVNIYEKFSTVRVADTSNVPETIEDIYVITYDLTGFEIDLEENNIYKRYIVYKKDNIYIHFTQKVKYDYRINLNTEDNIIEEITVNGCDGIYFYDNQEYYTIIYDTGEYVLSFYSNIGKDRLIQIAESIQKVE